MTVAAAIDDNQNEESDGDATPETL